MVTASKLFTRRAAIVAIAAFFAVSIGGVIKPLGTAQGGWIYVKEQPVLRVAPTPVPNKKGVITIAGVGFEPNQELGLRLVMGGVMSDIRHQVKPTPKTDKTGAFASSWNINRELRLLGPGVHTLMAVNEDGDVIAQAPLVIDKKAKKSKGKKKK